MTSTTPIPTPPTSCSPDSMAAVRARRRFVGAAAALAAVLGLGLASYRLTDTVLGDAGDAELIALQDVPADVRAELDLTWGHFLDRFEARTECFDDVSVELVRAVDGGDARYVVDENLIEIEIPTTPARFRESLAHELGHHIEHTCSDFAALRDELQPLLGGPDRAWAGGEVWEETPSELWAEAVVQLVNGERIRHADEVVVEPAVIDLIRSWGLGRYSRAGGLRSERTGAERVTARG